MLLIDVYVKLRLRRQQAAQPFVSDLGVVQVEGLQLVATGEVGKSLVRDWAADQMKKPERWQLGDRCKRLVIKFR